MAFNLDKFKQLALFLTPLVLPAFGVDPALTNLIVHGVTLAETAANGNPKTGAEKKAIALDAIKTGLDAVNAARPGTVNVGEVLDAANDGIDSTLKAIKAAKNVPVHPL